MTSEPLNQYTEISRDAIKSSSAKLSKTFESLLLEIPNQKLISHTVKELFGRQRKAALPLSQILTNYCIKSTYILINLA